MSRPAFGMLEAAQHARAWAPRLETQGQRLVFIAVVLFVGSDSIADPTATQLAEVTGFHVSSVRRILRQLEDRGALTPVGSRPVFDANGRGRGGRVTLWYIPPAPLGANLPPAPLAARMGDSHPRHGSIPPAPSSPPTRASEGAPLIADKADGQQPCASHTFNTSTIGNRQFTHCIRCGISEAAAQRARREVGSP